MGALRPKKDYATLVKLCVAICKCNGKKKPIWFSNKSCPGNWLYFRIGKVAAEATKQLSESTEKKDEPNKTCSSFKVKVSITDLNIRKDPGTNYDKTDKFTEVKFGQISKAGWIALDYAKTI